jgi:hypothetical protein
MQSTHLLTSLKLRIVAVAVITGVTAAAERPRWCWA